MMSSLLLRVNELNLATSNGTIVSDLSFEINRGEIVALTGKSGSGKTSIALALLGLLPEGVKLVSGSIEFFKNENSVVRYPDDLNQWPSLRGSHIGFIQQDVYGAFNPILKMGKQMLMVIHERSQQKEADHEAALKSVMLETGLNDIERIWNSYPHQLSGGQLQRCLLCMALSMRPSLIIADEPTSAIDKINQVEILDVLAFIRKKYNIAILCISHEPAVVHYLSDRAIQLEQTSGGSMQIENKPVRDIGGEGNILQVDGLGYSHKFGGLLSKSGAVIKDMTFNLEAGQCLGIIGESGSGKSTLAQMLVGLLVPSEGSVAIHDRQIDFNLENDVRYLRSKVQLVMQDGKGSLHPNKSIRQLMIEVVDQQKKINPQYAPDLANILAEVDLPLHVLERRSGSLSGGECLRVSIARALLLDPDILICDESTSALDEITRNGILGLFKDLLDKRKMGLILISHDAAVIRSLADQIIVFSEGRIIEQGDAEHVVSQPVHPATRKIFSAEATLAVKKDSLSL